MMPDIAIQIAANGFAVINGVVCHQMVSRLRQAISDLESTEAVRRKKSVYGVRNLLDLCPEVRELAGSPQIRQFVSLVLGESCFAVRAVFFDKVPDANWGLCWHQDSVIAVQERREVNGFLGWSLKAGVWQVQPPPAVLADMLAVRVHLDRSDRRNGPLRVLPGSHRYGWLDDEIDNWKRDVPQVVCEADVGGLVIMRPLLLHASAAAECPSHRRVIHLEFARSELPGGLLWQNRIGATTLA